MPTLLWRLRSTVVLSRPRHTVRLRPGLLLGLAPRLLGCGCGRGVNAANLSLRQRAADASPHACNHDDDDDDDDGLRVTRACGQPQAHREIRRARLLFWPQQRAALLGSSRRAQLVCKLSLGRTILQYESTYVLTTPHRAPPPPLSMLMQHSRARTCQCFAPSASEQHGQLGP